MISIEVMIEHLFVVGVFKWIRTSSDLEIGIDIGFQPFFVHHSAPLRTALYQTERQMCCT